MKLDYFKNIKSLNELKKEYRRLAKAHHPDIGGDTVIMARVINEYSFVLKDTNFIDIKDYIKETTFKDYYYESYYDETPKCEKCHKYKTEDDYDNWVCVHCILKEYEDKGIHPNFGYCNHCENKSYGQEEIKIYGQTEMKF